MVVGRARRGKSRCWEREREVSPFETESCFLKAALLSVVGAITS